MIGRFLVDIDRKPLDTRQENPAAGPSLRQGLTYVSHKQAGYHQSDLGR